MNLKSALVALICFFSISLQAEPNTKTFVVKAGKSLAKVQPTMWGLFFEDINFAADGGIYAELVKNRSFEFYKPLMGWKKSGETYVGQFQVITGKNENNPRFLRLESPEGKELSFTNEGFRGMGVIAGGNYNFSVWARQPEGAMDLRVELLDSADQLLGQTVIRSFSGDWKKYEARFTCSATTAKAKLRIVSVGKGVLELDMVSLFPEHTWKNRPNGLRADLVQKLADLKPGFLRFPGGCIVEGHELETRYQWKKTVGSVETRQSNINRWNTEFPHRNAPDYFQSYGLGFFEYFLLAEDLGAEPLPILNCGMACQYNTGELAPVDCLDPYIQDVIDLIEFANGKPETKWGRLRADMGHPEPFNLKYVGVGNEQWGTQYIERLKLFLEILTEKHPEIVFVGGSGPSPDGKDFDYLWKEMHNLGVKLVDEHYYRSPDWFFQNAARYDLYDRSGPKVFAGEYAAHDKDTAIPESKNTWKSALSEAALMTGLERNADIVHMASYAPLFGNVHAWQWRPDLIWFDNLKSAATPNYYVQKMFSTNAGTDVVAVLSGGQALTGQDSLYASAVIDSRSSELIVKLVNAAHQPVKITLDVQEKNVSGKEIRLQILQHSDWAAFNPMGAAEVISPVEKVMPLKGRKIILELDGKSFTVAKVGLKH